jgi:hypothetical protein
MVKEKEALETGIQAYVYAYPLVMMGQTLRVSTNVATPEGTSAPMGRFAHVREYPTPEFKTVVAPNADTLYSVLWLDVAKEPWIVSVPDMKGRYFMLPLLDGWTTVFAVPGTRTTGTGAQKFAITGPGWTGTLPAGVKEYKSPTAIVWLLGRIYSTGTPEDYKAVQNFPGITSELESAGAEILDFGNDVAWLTPQGWGVRFASETFATTWRTFDLGPEWNAGFLI